MSRFFIDRPVFAWVVGLVIMLIGAVSILSLPVAQYPNIAAPQISVSVTYPGASADTVMNTVVRPIEQQMYGLDGLEYVSSVSQSSGAMEIDLTFAQGTDPNIAQVQVQNKLSLAEANLPSEVTTQGISVTKGVKSFMMIVGFVSTDGSMTSQDIADYVASNIQTRLSRVTGVGDYTQFGSEYAMRIWLDPGKLNKYSLTVGDVSAAIQAQNVQVASGELGGLPAPRTQRLNATIIGPSRFQDVSQFESILLKVTTEGGRILLRDVARVELGAQSYAISSNYNNQPASGIGLKLAAGANQLSTEAGVKAELEDLSRTFPAGLKIVYPLDTRPFITQSIEEVVKTLFIAILLVFAVMYVFLQNIRATLIPTLAVPIVLLGTFGVMSALGYSINTLTMLAMVLAVGLLVDDAIVVVENVERVMADQHLSPRDAAQVSMGQISGALVGIALVLAAVFLPMAFISGSTGVIYRQFSVTIVSAMTLSVIVALIVTPALCATLLKAADHDAGGRPKAWPFRIFDRGFDATQSRYVGVVRSAVAHPVLSFIAFALIMAGTAVAFTRVPGGFIPDEDQGLIFGQVAAPPGTAASQTDGLARDLVSYLLTAEKDTVESAFSVVGFNFAGQAQNAAFVAIKLKDWSERARPEQSSSAIAQRVNAHFATLQQAKVIAFQPPAVMELGNATGFDFELEDRNNLGHARFLQARDLFLQLAGQDPTLVAVRPNGIEDAPQYRLVIDREKANALGVTTSDLNTTIGGALASSYVDQFLRDGRVKQVYIQGEASSRMLPDDLGSWYVRNTAGTMVPFSSFLTGTWTVGTQKAERYNSFDAFEILGQPAPGISSGQAIAAVKRILTKMPPGVGGEWTGLSYEQQKAGSQTSLLYGVALIAILFCLAALYESWTVPVAVLLVVPLGACGSVVATWLAGLDNDVYFQVGLLTTAGLAVKNGILIVEFAKQFFDEGKDLVTAATEAARERLRPILMTSLAFVLGTVPLAVATGAGAASRIALGMAVVGGMLTATIFAVFLVPVFFVAVLRLFRVKPRRVPTETRPATALAELS